MFLIKGIFSLETWSIIFSIFVIIVTDFHFSISGEARFLRGSFNGPLTLYRIREILERRNGLLGGPERKNA